MAFLEPRLAHAPRIPAWSPKACVQRHVAFGKLVRGAGLAQPSALRRKFAFPEYRALLEPELRRFSVDARARAPQLTRDVPAIVIGIKLAQLRDLRRRPEFAVHPRLTTTARSAAIGAARLRAPAPHRATPEC